MAPPKSTSTTLPDPTDWLPTPLSPLTTLDSLLRCQICKDFYTSAVLTNCSHSFCSLCIRRCLAAEARCPSCRAPEQESRLRRNGALQEVVDGFVGARERLLGVAMDMERKTQEQVRGEGEADGRRLERSTNTRGAKRKREAVAQEDEEQAPQQRTRSQRKAAQSSSQRSSTTTAATQLDRSPAGDTVMTNGNSATSPHVLDSDDPDAEYTPSPPISSAPRSYPATSHPQSHPEPPALNDGLVACPACGKRMKEDFVFTHLDTCTGADDTISITTNPKHTGSPAQPISIPQSSTGHPATSIITKPPVPPPTRLPQLSYSLLRDTALRKKLSDLRIPAWGPRSLLIKRHSEYLALWNANCDSSRPRSRAEVLRDLEGWERSLGGRSVEFSNFGMGGANGNGNGEVGGSGGGTNGGGGGGAGVKGKEFESEVWGRKHGEEFKELVRKAREGRDKARASTSTFSSTAAATADIVGPESHHDNEDDKMKLDDALSTPSAAGTTTFQPNDPAAAAAAVHKKPDEAEQMSATSMQSSKPQPPENEEEDIKDHKETQNIPSLNKANTNTAPPPIPTATAEPEPEAKNPQQDPYPERPPPLPKIETEQTSAWEASDDAGVHR